MFKANYNLLVTAHPDDEVIFFSGLLQTLRNKPWTLICVTDGNADGKGQIRAKELQMAARKLKIKKLIQWDFPDLFNDRLPITRLIERLESLPKPAAIYTHGILGEYGHPHHQDVSLACHRTFAKQCPVYSLAYNCYPEKIIKLSPAQYRLKTKILSEIYFSETKRFSNMLPAQAHEGYVQVDLKEIEALYQHLLGVEKIDPKKLKTYKWYTPYLHHHFRAEKTRPF